MLHVVIDTSIYRSDPGRRQAGFKAIERLSRYGKLTLHIPYFVEQEFLTQQIEEYESALTNVHNSITDLQRKHLSSELSSWLKGLEDQFVSNKEAIRNYAATEFTQWAQGVNAVVHPIAETHGMRVAHDYFKGALPFKSKKNRKDIPDSFIWQTILDLCTNLDKVFVIAGDSAFKVACEPLTNVLYFNSITDFLSSDDCKLLLPEVNFKDNIEKFRKAVATTIDLIREIINEQFNYHLEGREIQSYLVPSDNGEAYIACAYEADALDLDISSSQYYGEGVFIIPFSVIIDADLDYAIFKGDYYALNKQRLKSLFVQELNDHYFQAGETLILRVDGTVSVGLDKRGIEETELSEEQIVQAIKDSQVKIDAITNIEIMPENLENQLKISDQLEVEQIYSRKQLREMFNIRDATINTGVFRPANTDSIWLFVTERKTSDRTQYSDYLEGDILHWDGQISGRTDQLIIYHQEQGLEILVFYRKDKNEYPESSFRYEGVFKYVSHEGSHPTHFKLQRIPPLIINVVYPTN